MNKIDIRSHIIPSGHKRNVFFIDNIPLYEYISKWVRFKPKWLKSLSPIDDLECCWTDDYDFEGDARFMRFILTQDEGGITPILSCPDDFDFSCLVVVVEVEKQPDKVIWKRIGKVDHSGELIEEEIRKGIAYVEAYSEDRKCFGDNIALADVNSDEWGDWIGKNWSEELYRRRINYTYPYYQNKNNIKWFAKCNFEFDRIEYDALIEKCYGEVKK